MTQQFGFIAFATLSNAERTKLPAIGPAERRPYSFIALLSVLRSPDIHENYLICAMATSALPSKISFGPFNLECH